MQNRELAGGEFADEHLVPDVAALHQDAGIGQEDEIGAVADNARDVGHLFPIPRGFFYPIPVEKAAVPHAIFAVARQCQPDGIGIRSEGHGAVGRCLWESVFA